MSPSLAARMAATFDRLSDGRLLVNVVTGGDPVELAGDGLHVSHDERYEITDEFLTVWRSELAGRRSRSMASTSTSAMARLIPGVQKPHPPLYFGGSSPAAQKVAAKHVDLYLTWGEPPDQVAEKIASVRRLAEAEGRAMRFGIRLHVIVRETDEQAWKDADDLISRLDDETIARAQKVFARMDSHGQSRMKSLHDGSREGLEISPNLWAGVGLVRGGAGTALVGDADTVTQRMREYEALASTPSSSAAIPTWRRPTASPSWSSPALACSPDAAAAGSQAPSARSAARSSPTRVPQEETRVARAAG